MRSHTNFDWNHLRAFLAVVDTGSLSAAGRAISLSQPTLSRNIAELEASLGIVLFERMARGLRLTEAGTFLLEPARQMHKNAELLSHKALSQSKQVEGTVRISASEMLSGHILPPIISKLRRVHPGIQIDLVATDNVVNLLERHADIAVRHIQPKQADTISKKLGVVEVGLFAHSEYLKQVGGEIACGHQQGYDWIGLDQSDFYIKEFKLAGQIVNRDFFNIRCDNVMVGWQLALAGAGITPAYFSVAEKFPYMQPVYPESSVKKVPIWLVAHRELSTNPRMRIVYDALAEGIRGMILSNPSS